MTVAGFTFNAFSENTYVLIDNATRQCAIIDPGCSSAAEEHILREYIEVNDLQVALLLNTHAHIDHVLGCRFVLEAWRGTPYLLHRLDLPTLRGVPADALTYGIPPFEPAEPTGELVAGQPVRFGHTELEVRFTPGHAPGHVVFYHAPTATLIGGDVLFKGSIGRTDLAGGNHAELLHSIETQLMTLPDDTTVYPGHGPSTTIGEERRTNPFLT